MGDLAMRKQRIKRITEKTLRKLILSEVAKLSGKLEDTEKVKAEEVDAKDLANSIENDVDHYKELKEQEDKLFKAHLSLVKRARKIREARKKAKRKILRKLK